MMSKYNAPASQIAINWLLAQDNVATITASQNPDHIDENLASLRWAMDPEDVELL